MGWTRFHADVLKEGRLVVRDRRALVVSALIPVLVLWAYSYVEPPAEVRFDKDIFRTTDPTALVVSLSVMFPALLVGAAAVVRERSLGTLDRLSRTPMNTLEFVGAKMAVLFAVSFLQVVLVLVVAMTALDNITIADASGFLGRLGLAALAFLALGLFISALSATENQALAVTALLVLIMLVLCGFLAPLENLGRAEPVARALPYTHAYLASYYFLKGLEPDGAYTLFLLIDTVVLFALAAFVVHMRRRHS